jgi:hypothetical protein
MEALHGGKATLGDLIVARNSTSPSRPAFFLYVDQGEGLYVRAEQRQRQRFSEILAHALPDSRLRMMMSMRSDFFGDLQKDEALFAAIQSGQSSNRVLCHFDEDGVFLQSDACIHTRARASRRRFSRGNDSDF